MGDTLPSSDPWVELPQQIIVIAGSYEHYRDWCRRNGLSPHNRGLIAIYRNTHGNQVRRDADVSRVQLLKGWEDLIGAFPNIGRAICRRWPTAPGVPELAEFVQDRPELP